MVITALAAAGLPVMRMNPKRVRDFARAHVACWPRPTRWTPTCWLYSEAARCGRRCAPGPRPSAATVGNLGDERQQQLTLQLRRRAHTASPDHANPS